MNFIPNQVKAHKLSINSIINGFVHEVIMLQVHYYNIYYHPTMFTYDLSVKVSFGGTSTLQLRR